jgi:hypothetical protein
MYECYRLLDPSLFDSSAMGKHARLFSLLYCALEREALQQDANSLSWHCKPKMHSFLELTEFIAPVDGNPREYWCYRDEGWVGEVVVLASHLGGHNSAFANAKRMLDKYKAQNGLPQWIHSR